MPPAKRCGTRRRQSHGIFVEVPKAVKASFPRPEVAFPRESACTISCSYSAEKTLRALTFDHAVTRAFVQCKHGTRRL